MRIKAEFTWKKHYLEILPSIAFRWRPFGVYFGWLFWNLYGGDV